MRCLPAALLNDNTFQPIARGENQLIEEVHERTQGMVRQGKSLLRVTPERWGPVATGGFPPRLA